MQTKNVKERKFHDSWAFYLFLILCLILNAIYIFNTSNVTEAFIKLNSESHIFKIIGMNLLFIISGLLISLILCYLIPKVIVFLSIVLVPGLVLISTYDLIKNSENAGIIRIAVAIFSLLFILMACLLVLKHIDYISQVISLTSKIFFINIFGILSVFVLSVLMMAIFTIPVLFVDVSEGIIQKLKWVSILLFVWEALIASYFLEVYVSSVIFSEINNDGRDTFVESFKIASCAIGSISYGALLYAVIIVLELMIKTARKKQQQRGEKPNIFIVIIAAVAEFFVSILGDIVKFANGLAFPYLSVNGTPYEESVVKGFETLSKSGFEKVASLSGLGFVIYTVVFSFGLGSYFANFYFILDNAGLSVGGDDKIIVSILIAFASILLFSSVFSLLRSASLSLIYTCVAIPEKIREYDHDFVDLVNNKKQELSTDKVQQENQ